MTDIETIDIIAEIGRQLLLCGAEIYRVEESIKRMCQGLGFQNVEIFAIPSYYTLSLKLHDGSPYAVSKRAFSPQTNLDQLNDLNNLVRHISNNSISVEQAKIILDDIISTKTDMNKVALGYSLLAAMFAIFFGGHINEAILSAILGLAIYFIVTNLKKYKVNNIIRTLLCSTMISAISIICSKVGLIQEVNSAIIGCLMLLVPGIAITNSLRDISGGDYVSGVARMSEAFLIASTIAIGVGISMMFLGGF